MLQQSVEENLVVFLQETKMRLALKEMRTFAAVYFYHENEIYHRIPNREKGQ